MRACVCMCVYNTCAICYLVAGADNEVHILIRERRK